MKQQQLKAVSILPGNGGFMTSDNCLRQIRQDKGLALRALAASSGVPAATLSDIERYGYHPSEKTRRQIAETLGVDVAEIWPALEGCPR
jgi:transcriptional regulator with XRE-family HTH domain